MILPRKPRENAAFRQIKTAKAMAQKAKTIVKTGDQLFKRYEISTCLADCAEKGLINQTGVKTIATVAAVISSKISHAVLFPNFFGIILNSVKRKMENGKLQLKSAF